MVRNRLEKIGLLFIALDAINYLLMGINSMLISWLNKYNYREYIKKIETGYNPLNKVLLRLLSYKGKGDRVFCLVFKFFNLVDAFFTFFTSLHLLKSLLLGFCLKIHNLVNIVYFALFCVYFKFYISLKGNK